MDKKIISWWSGGVSSAVTCHLAIQHYGIDNVRMVFIDTENEDPDTYRFYLDCQNWYGKEIEVISGLGDRYKDIQAVWGRYNSLNVANGAVCSAELKRKVRERWQKKQEFDHQAFGFDINEARRARSMSIQHSKINPIFPLLLHGLSKGQCIDIIQEAGIEVPVTYLHGFENNNCFKTGCVQGGIGYWQKMQRDFPMKFEAMAQVEHDLTNKKGQPVTMMKDQAKDGGLLFLKPHPDYPLVKDVSMKKGREPQPLMECNGFCGTNDLNEERNPTQDEIADNQITMFE